MYLPPNLRKELELGSEGLAFDLDDTLCSTRLAWFQKKSELFGNPEGLSPSQLQKKWGHTNQVPYWQTPEILAWSERFRESNEVQENLPPREEALHYIPLIEKIFHLKVYLTCRPESVRLGTERWLEKYHLPSAPLILRPSEVSYHEGNAWKAQMLEQLFPTVLGIVDDEPKLAEAFSADYRGTHFLYGSSVAPRTEIDVRLCPTFEEVLRQVEISRK